MCVHPTQIVDMQGDAGMIDEALEEFTGQINIEVADTLTREIHIEFQPRAPGKIDNHSRECLIERHIGVTITAQTFFIATSLGKCLPQRDADILHRMVRIDMQITLGLDRQIDEPMAGNLIEHVIEKRHTAIQTGLARTIQIEMHADLGFESVAADFCLPHGMTLYWSVSD